MAELTEKCLLTLVEGKKANNETIVQLLDYSLIQWNGKPRYRLDISDGFYKTNFALLARNLNSKIHLLEDFSILKITTNIVSRAGSAKRLLIVNSFENFCNFDDLNIKYLDLNLKKINSYGTVEQSFQGGAVENYENILKRRRICGK